MAMDRRAFLAGTAGLAATAWLPLGCASWVPGGSVLFQHGVASGDPLSDRVILWTRVSPEPGVTAVDVRWEIAEDPDFKHLVGKGRVRTDVSRDLTVKVDAVGLAPGEHWFYRFEALGQRSPVGRTRTLPVGAVDHVRFAVCSCSNYPQGYFNAYAAMALREDIDAVLHLGDYIYEYGADGYGGDAGLGRDVEPRHEITSLDDYRTRYAQYRSDPDLQALHRLHPFIVVWDDHESANDSWSAGAQNHQPEREGDWVARKAAAVRAYFEWMPIRAVPGSLRAGRIHRSFRYGDLVDLIMLDTRLTGRDRQVSGQDVSGLEDPARTLLGREQEAWLAGELERSQADGTAWRVLGQQVMLGQMVPPGLPSHNDGWDGYRAARARLLRDLDRTNIRDVIALTGDYHSSWAMEITDDPFSDAAYDPVTGRGVRAVEFIAPAVSSSPLGSSPRLAGRFDGITETHPHVRLCDVEQNGYFMLDLDRERARADWFWQRTVREPGVDEVFGAAWATERGRPQLVAQAPSAVVG